MVAGAGLIAVAVLHLFTRDILHQGKGFENGHGIVFTPANIIHLGYTGCSNEGIHKSRHIGAVDIVADLLALIPENGVGLFGKVTFYQVAEKAMELHTAVIGAREAPPPQAAGRHIEVAAIFLHQHIGSNFACAKKAVLALVYRKVFGDTFRIGRIGIIPAGVQLSKGDGIGPVAIHFVGAHVHEGRFGRKLACRFQQVERAHGVGVKIIERYLCGFVVAGLRGCMHNCFGAKRFYQI